MEQKFQEIVGGNLATLLVAKGMSQRALACCIGVAPSYICNIANGRKDVRVSTLKRIADALQVPMWALLDTHEHENGKER